MLLKLLRFVIVLSCLLSLPCAAAAGQALNGPASSAHLQHNSADNPEAAAREQRLISMLLSRAQRALHKDQLKTPATDNAFGWYQQVLLHDSDNAEAHWGMRRIGARYLELAEQSYISGKRYQAEQLLQQGESVSLSPLLAQQMRNKYAHIKVPANEFLLDASALSARSDAVVQRLAEIAWLARAESSRLTIYARNDAEGRWIYKQMRAAVDGFRLRGNILVSSTPRVVLIDLNS
jgi:hypothetical protein